MRSFGTVIADARKAAGLTQRELAAAISREGGETGISPAYLNDIEHNRRVPNNEHIIGEFAKNLNVDSGYLLLLASRQLPEDIAAEARAVDPNAYREALTQFRQTLASHATSRKRKAAS